MSYDSNEILARASWKYGAPIIRFRGTLNPYGLPYALLKDGDLMGVGFFFSDSDINAAAASKLVGGDWQKHDWKLVKLNDKGEFRAPKIKEAV